MTDMGCESKGLVDSLQLGWRVWFFELKWLCKGLSHAWRRRQLAKRLAEEHELLGRLEMESGSAEERDQARRQAAFLQEEIERLDDDFAARRAFERSQRLQGWGLA
jgi:hypothetical protein